MTHYNYDRQAGLKTKRDGQDLIYVLQDPITLPEGPVVTIMGQVNEGYASVIIRLIIEHKGKKVEIYESDIDRKVRPENRPILKQACHQVRLLVEKTPEFQARQKQDKKQLDIEQDYNQHARKMDRAMNP